MLDWNKLHPYNAVHVVRVPAALDLPRLREAIQATLAGLGLTNLSVDHEGGDFHYGGGLVVSEITLIEDGSPAGSSLAAEIERQLNTPFPRSEIFEPFRFFVVPEQSSFSLGLSYFHPVADAEAIVWLLKRLVEAYRAGAAAVPERGCPQPQHIPTTGAREWTNVSRACEAAAAGDSRGPLWIRLRRAAILRSPGTVLGQIAALPAFIRMLRTSIRPRYRDVDDLRNGFTSFTLEPAALDWLRTAGKSWGVTLNDLFLALLLHSLAPLAGSRCQARRRRMAAGCIVNVRKDLGVSPGTFGLFLGSFMVAHEVPEGIGLKELVAAIALLTARIKARRLYLATPVQLAFAGFVLRFFSTRGKRSFYQKHCPLWGGITNMNLNTLWEEQAQDGPLDYLRAVSTGPVTPLVLSITTSGERVNVGLSYRSTVFSAAEIAQVQRRLLDGVASLASFA